MLLEQVHLLQAAPLALQACRGVCYIVSEALRATHEQRQRACAAAARLLRRLRDSGGAVGAADAARGVAQLLAVAGERGLRCSGKVELKGERDG
ncbi:hypothetical protein FA09DRAFT_152524 [Tilletiopsis washingtonensis]|uniref:Uncharacterized protein n=1 Tax=Tilletiopsis washingtonensis TaxID=58919 RepID=A0A316Z1C5_9BASI|nr:hypothetical protein FA09DRAFT_152524 [Tilletiopsis washingtonensis]PWN95166.1 hypothetical protein FA09DRAFT_152524 [Tilletiopsis washingtonensis]